MSNTTMERMETSKHRSSASQILFIIETMERQGDLSRPQPGLQGRIKSDRLWRELTEGLNAIGDGVVKTPEKWKKVWADLKSKTKKRAAEVRASLTRTGGGKGVKPLIDLEERVLNIMGIGAVEGIDVAEVGPGEDIQSVELVEEATNSTTTNDQVESIVEEQIVHLATTPTRRHAVTPRLITSSPVSHHFLQGLQSPRRTRRPRRPTSELERVSQDFREIENRRIEVERLRIEADLEIAKMNKSQHESFMECMGKIVTIAEALIKKKD